MLNKTETRILIKKARTLIANKSVLDEKIFKNIINSEIYKNSKTILLYASTNYEVDTYRLIECALNDNKIVGIPISDFSDKTMRFHQITSIKELSQNNHGIKEPEKSSKQITDYSNSICIVPALVFDLKGFRIGYGGGFYDRFLNSYNGITFGVCYDCFLWKQLDISDYDMPVDYIITDFFVKLPKN